jgi:hypothetical protein
MVNEPGTHACRECGKWASLFDLQDTKAEARELGVEELEIETVEPQAFEPGTFEPGTFEPGTFETGTFEPGGGEEAEPEQVRWKQILSSLAVPLALLVYFVISFFADR